MKGGIMNNYSSQVAASIIDKLIKHPCAAPFIEPIDKNSQQFPNYYSIVTDPIDLLLIKKRTLTLQYKSVSEWRKEVKQIQINAEKYSGANSTLNILAQHLMEIFEKYDSLFVCYSTSQWSKAFYSLSTKMQFLSQKMPENQRIMTILSYTPKMMLPFIPTVNHQEVTFSKFKIDKEVSTFRIIYEPSNSLPMETLGKDDILNLLEALNQLNTSSDVKKIATIITKNQPELELSGNNVEVDFKSLSNDSINEILKYTKERFESMNLPYPSIYHTTC